MNDRLALHADTIYYRNSAVGGVVTNDTATNMTLIDYDNLPDNIVIPNGGFETDPTLPNGGNPDLPFSLPLVTKIVAPNATPTNVWVNGKGETQTALRQNRDISALENNLYNKRTKIVLDQDQVPRPTITSAPVTSARGSAREELDDHEYDDEAERAVAGPLKKRAVSNVTLTRFSGIMFHTFFGGSSVTWNSPKNQYSYFKGVSMAINGPVNK